MPRQTHALTREQQRRRRKILLRVLAFILLILLACVPAYLISVQENAPREEKSYTDIASVD